MKKLYLVLLGGLLALIIFVSQVSAFNNGQGNSAGKGKVFKLPEQAKQVRPNVYYLGKAKDKGKTVEGYAIIDYRKGYGKPGTECGNGVCEKSENNNNCPQDCGGGNGDEEPSADCYGFLAKGAKWRVEEPYLVNPNNTRGLDATKVIDIVAEGIDEWETAADTGILGPGNSTNKTLVADTMSTDGENEVYFGDIEENGAIGITIVWGIFRGRPDNRELVEWDQIYNQADYDWSTSGEGGKMDFANIATHELGHSVGLDDLYTSECSEQTMYGYADYGETNKRSLENGDKAGVYQLYN